MMLEEKHQRNTDLKRTSQGGDVLLNKTRIQQDFSKGGLDLITGAVYFISFRNISWQRLTTLETKFLPLKNLQLIMGKKKRERKCLFA